MIDDQWDDQLSEAARSYHQPPETPREEIWARIQEQRRHRGLRVRWLHWGAGIAAVLALGIGIGRLTVHSGGSPELAGGTALPRPVRDGAAMSITASQHLSRAEALLTGFRAEARGSRPEKDFSVSARELLSTTRLLLDSPDLKDPRTKALLEDLELVLAQIIQWRPDHGPDEAELITQGLNQRDLLPRLRSAIPAGQAVPRARGES